MQEVLQTFLKKVVFPVAAVGCLAFIFYPMCVMKDGNASYPILWMICGIPFGVRHMFVRAVPYGSDPMGIIEALVFNLVLGGVIGGFVLIWRLVCAVFYLFKCIYDLVRIERTKRAFRVCQRESERTEDYDYGYSSGE